MKKTVAFALLALAPSLNAQNRSVAFEDVNVVPLNTERVLSHQTVVVSGERIAQIGSSSSVKVPGDTVTVDARGKFLMPGLADMHVHFMRSPAGESLPFRATDSSLRTTRPASASPDYERENEAFAVLFLANGITTVRNMWGNSAIDAFAKAIDSGSAFGPHIYSVGLVTDGNPPIWEGSRVVETQEQAIKAVHSDKQAGYIAFKVYGRLSKVAYKAIVAAARREGLPVVGHVPADIGLLGAIAARQDSIEHLSGFLEALQPELPGSRQVPERPT